MQCNSVAFSGELCAWHFSQTFSGASSNNDVSLFCSRTSFALYFTQFARWRGHFKNKPFLVCHSHTPTDCMLQSQLSLTALNLFSVLWIGKSYTLKRDSAQFIYIFSCTFGCVICQWYIFLVLSSFFPPFCRFKKMLLPVQRKKKMLRWLTKKLAK